MSQHEQQPEPPFMVGVSQTLAKAVGVVGAIFVTPAVYEVTKLPVFHYLTKSYGADLATWLTWLSGVVEAVILYNVLALGFAFGVSYLLAYLAARGLGR